MLAGLLFAIADADDRPDRLTATLPFAGVTLIEHQARLLVTAGVSQIVILVARLTPELLGAMNRIGRCGVSVDAVRSAAEALEKLHPLAAVLALADGLITTHEVTAALAGEGGDALLVLPEAEAAPSFERVGGHMAWAGIARFQPERMAEAAALPRDYDMQSTLIRVASQAHAAHVPLPAGALRHGHGIEHGARALEDRGRLVLAAIVSSGSGWFDRFVTAPIARLALPPMVERMVPAGTLAAGGVAVGAGGLAALLLGYPKLGLLLALLGNVALALGATLGELRDETGLVRAQRIAATVLPALAALALGWQESGRSAEGTALAAALALVAIGGLGERAMPPGGRRPGWGGPPAYLLVLAVATIVGVPMIGLSLAGLYATGTALAVIETLRRARLPRRSEDRAAREGAAAEITPP